MTSMETAGNKFGGRRFLLGTGFILLLAGVWLWPPLGWAIPACMAAGMGLGAAYGRGPWCGGLCLRGNFLDHFGGLLNGGGRVPAAFARPAPRYAVLAGLMGVMSFNLYAAWPDPLALVMVFARLLTGTTAAAVVLAALFHRRAWCAVCPVGTVSWAGGALRRKK